MTPEKEQPKVHQFTGQISNVIQADSFTVFGLILSNVSSIFEPVLPSVRVSVFPDLLWTGMTSWGLEDTPFGHY